MHIMSVYGVYEVTPVDFSVASFGASSGGGSSFDPSKPQNITGAWIFQNTLTLDNNQKLSLGNGLNALTMQGNGTSGGAVIEGGNGTNLDVSVGITFQDSALFQDAVTFYGDVTRTSPAVTQGADLLSKDMADVLYAKLNIGLTQAQYDALTTKDPRTIYVTTDTAKVYMGSVIVNP